MWNAARRTARGAVIAAACSLALAASLPAGSASAHVLTVDGGGFGAQVDVTLVLPPALTLGPVVPVDLPDDGGGPFTANLASAGVAGVLSTGALTTSTTGGNLGTHEGYASTSAQVANVAVLVDLLTATLIASSCTSNGDGSTASTTLAGASLSGIGSLAVSPAPNTVIPLPGLGSITLNEQTRTDVVGSTSAITVTAVHVHLTAGIVSGDIYISQSRCQVNGPDVLVSPVVPVDTTEPTNPDAPTNGGAPQIVTAIVDNPVVLTPTFTG